MGSRIKDQYNIAINDTGYILRGAPDKPAYQKSIVASQIDRLAISDVEYSDFSGSGLFFIAQTEWASGIKAEKKWRDDGKYYYSSNIDAYSEVGALQLEKEWVEELSTADHIRVGTIAAANGSLTHFLGCDDEETGYIKIYRYWSGSWANIAGTDFGTNQNSTGWLTGHKDLLWAGTIGTGSTDVIASWNGSTWTDHSAAIITASTLGGVRGSRGVCEIAGVLYVDVNDYVNDRNAIMSTVDNGTTWVEEYYWEGDNFVVSMAAYNSKVFYILYDSPTAELRVYDPSTGGDTLVKSFEDVAFETGGLGNRATVVYNNKLVISINKTGTTTEEIWEYDGSNMTRIFVGNDKGDNYRDYMPYTFQGCVEYKGRLHWGGLIYDGEYFYNWSRVLGDSATDRLYPIMTDTTGDIYVIDENDTMDIYVEAATYKSTLANNFLLFNEMQPIVSIDKMLYSATLLFETLASGEEIHIEYSIDGQTTWNDVGSVTSTTEGANTKREFIISGSVIFNKIWWRVTLDGSTTTPKLLDFIMAYKPMPDYKHRWGIRLDMANSVGLLSGQKDERTGADMEAGLWNEKAVKQKVAFKDVDYIECSMIGAMPSGQVSATVDSTIRFPRQGRIRAVSGGVAEEITYTSAESNKLLGMTRGVRGTRARAYLSGQTLKNDYDVYIETISSEANFTDEKTTESIAQVLLIEA
jgi:hypothetical protein